MQNSLINNYSKSLLGMRQKKIRFKCASYFCTTLWRRNIYRTTHSGQPIAKIPAPWYSFKVKVNFWLLFTLKEQLFVNDPLVVIFFLPWKEPTFLIKHSLWSIIPLNRLSPITSHYVIISWFIIVTALLGSDLSPSGYQLMCKHFLT